MWKKCLLVSLLCSATAVKADVLPYIGVETGLDIVDSNLRDVTGTKTNYLSRGALGGVFIGFGGTINDYLYLGLEVFGAASTADTSARTIALTSTETTSTDVRVKYNWGASFIPGFVVGNASMLYARFGYINTTFEWHQTNLLSTARSNLQSTPVSGGQIGLGAMINLTKYISLRGEIDYNSYVKYTSFENNRINTGEKMAKIGLVFTFE